MATFVAPVEVQLQAERAAPAPGRGFPLLLVSAFTVFALSVHGYHPYAEDGGLYIAGVKLLLNPILYPHATAFVLEPMRFSLFAPLVAGMVHLGHFSLSWVLLLLHLASIWLTLFAAWMLAARCWPQREACAGAVALLACWLTLPVAGTALFLMDPYLTARSLSTPCTLLALAATLDLTARDATPCRRLRGFLLASASLMFATTMHPLMAAYALFAVLTLFLIRSSRRSVRLSGTVALAIAILAVAAFLRHNAQPESADTIRIALTRTYWFPSRWAWYELLGLFAPLAILAAFSRTRGLRRRTPSNPPSGLSALAQMSIVVGLTACLAAILFARADAPTHLVARLQPLRAFQVVYLVMVLALGALLGQHMLRRQAWRWCAAVAALALPMFLAQRATFPRSNHLELPSRPPRNLWTQAFLWVRAGTPQDALFALDADYINAPGEDTQSFRAIAERSALPDYSKDGGEASIAPQLAPAWAIGQAAQQRLSAPQTTDAQRIAALRPLGVSWIVLQAGARTSFDCPYRNPAVEVCRLN